MTRTIAAFNGRSLDGETLLLCVAAKRTYSFGARATKLADVQAPLHEGPVVEVDAYGRHDWLREDSDCLAPKVATDVVITGYAEAQRPVTEMLVGVRVGTAMRTAVAVGERRAVVDHKGRARFTDPEPFERVALTWQNAYGGYDAYGHEVLDPPERRNGRRIFPGPRDEGNFAYPRNRVGRAYLLGVDRDRADGAPLPLLEDPSDRLTVDRLFVSSHGKWLDAPVPGGFGWISHTWYPRVARLLGGFLVFDPPSRPPRERSLPDGDDLDGPFRKNERLPRGVQGAAPGLAVATLRGGEPVVLRGLSASEPEIVFDLPRERPRLLVEPQGSPKVLEPAPVLQTVRIDAAARTLSLVWCGAVRVLAPLLPDQLSETRAAAEWR